MAQFTITHAGLNGNTDPIWLSDLYANLIYGSPLVIDYPASRFSYLTNLMGLAGDRLLTVTVSYSHEELSGGVVGLFSPAYPPLTPGRTIDLVNGQTTPLFSVTMADTLPVEEPLVPDNSFGCKVFFALECTDGTDVQIREGDVNAAVAFKAPVTFNTAQAVNQTGALTGGTLTVTWSWTTSGTTATLNVTGTSSLTLIECRLHWFILHSTHEKITYA